MKTMKVDILAELEAYGEDPEAYELIMGGTPEELFPEQVASVDTWLDTVYSK